MEWIDLRISIVVENHSTSAHGMFRNSRISPTRRGLPYWTIRSGMMDEFSGSGWLLMLFSRWSFIRFVEWFFEIGGHFAQPLSLCFDRGRIRLPGADFGHFCGDVGD